MKFSSRRQIEEACRLINDLEHWPSGYYYDVHFDMSDGEIILDLFQSPGYQMKIDYPCEDIIRIGLYSGRITEFELINCIADRVGDTLWRRECEARMKGGRNSDVCDFPD